MKNSLFSLPLLVFAVASAWAQSAPPAPAASSPTRVPRIIDLHQVAQEMAGSAMQQAAGAFVPERVVKGAPYCAEAVHEQVQWLADPNGGAPNRMVNKHSTRLCRDGEGRTRQEVERGGRKLVYLRDPVSRENWILDLERKTARKGGFSGWVDEGAMREHSERMREYAERMREWARGVSERVRASAHGKDAVAPNPPTPATPPNPPAVPAPPAPPMPAMITIGPGGGEREIDVRVMRLELGAGDTPPPPMSWTMRSFSPRGPGSTSPLPAKEMEGLRVNGERTSWTIDAGKVGNEKPIVMFREVWTSPELMLTVMSRDFDPRSGEVVYRLQNVKRGEPEAGLMRVPGDFTSAGSRRSERPERGEREKAPTKP